jgi:hypothetical protein
MNAEASPRSNRVALASLVALGIVGLLVLVAIGARASHPLGHTRGHQRYVPQRVGDDLFTLFVLVLSLGAVLFVAGLYSIRDRWQQRESRWILRLASTLLLLPLVALWRLVFSHFHRHEPPVPGGNPRTRSGRHSHLPTIVNPRHGAHFDWQFAALVGGILLLIVAYTALRRRGAQTELEPGPIADAEEVLSAVVREAIDDLRREPDPRRAVIAAYARMEGVLARHGYPRHAAEAPNEYVRRVLTDLNVAQGAIAELTELFELAKFSPHRIDEEMRERAIAAFVGVRDEVKVAA